jgi:hypothetical protein
MRAANSVAVSESDRGYEIFRMITGKLSVAEDIYSMENFHFKLRDLNILLSAVIKTTGNTRRIHQPHYLYPDSGIRAVR